MERDPSAPEAINAERGTNRITCDWAPRRARKQNKTKARAHLDANV